MSSYIEFYSFPEDWSKITILNSTYLKGRIGWQGLKASEFMSEGAYLVTGTDFNNGVINWDKCYHISEERFREAPEIHLKEHDLLITKDGTIGKIAIVKGCPEKAILNSGIFLLRCKNKSYSHSFLYYVLRSDYFKKYLLDTQGGSTIVHLYQREFEKFTFFAPKIEEQARIAEILNMADETITQTQALIAKYKRIKTGLMQNLLTLGIDAHGNIRHKAKHKFVVKNGIEVPEEWEVAKLSNISKPGSSYLRTGPFGSNLKISDWTEDGIPVVTIGSLGENTIQTNQLLYVSEKKAQSLSPYRLQEGDILFSRVADVGRSVVIDKEQAGWLMSSNFMRLRIDNQKMLPPYLQLNLLANNNVKAQIRQNANSGGRDIVNSEVLNSLYFPLPSTPEQTTILRRLSSINKFIEKEDMILLKLQALKRGMMQDLLSGKKRVKLKNVN